MGIAPVSALYRPFSSQNFRTWVRESPTSLSPRRTCMASLLEEERMNREKTRTVEVGEHQMG